MPYFLSDKNLSTNDQVELSGEEAAHVLFSHRSKKGDVIKLQGPNLKRFEAEIVNVNKKQLTVKILSEILVPKELEKPVTLFQAVVSEKALDFIFQKSTELGVSKIILFNSKNTAVKLSHDLFNKRLERWSKILSEAAKQSERAVCPTLEFCGDVDGLMEKFSDYDKIFLGDINGQVFSDLEKQVKKLAIIVGPEGGFTTEEIKSFKEQKNLQVVVLGNFVLRAETAAIGLCSILVNSIH